MDRLSEMEAFAMVIDQGGFTDAARKLGISKSAVSKQVSALETRLGARLLNRTTRRVSPTEIGMIYYERARRVLFDAVEADEIVSSMQSAPSGILRVAAPTDFGALHLSQVLGNFLTDFPSVSVNLEMTNRRVDLVADGFDAAIRIGILEDSNLRARKLASTHFCLIASPEYLAKNSTPQKVEDLANHKLLQHSSQATVGAWKINIGSGDVRYVRSTATLSVNDGQSLLGAAKASLGIAYLPSFLYAPAMAKGEVIKVMPDLPTEVQDIHITYLSGRYLQPKVRAFIDFLAHEYADKDAELW